MCLRQRAVRSVAAFACGAMLLTTAVPAHAFQCEDEIMAALEEVNMGKSDIKTVDVQKYPQFSGYKHGKIFSWDAWITTDRCEGHINVHLTIYCMVTDVYTTGGCQMAGMEEYW